MRRLLPLALFVACSAASSLAHAHGQDEPERKGLVLGMALSPGVAQYGRAVIPMM